MVFTVSNASPGKDEAPSIPTSDPSGILATLGIATGIGTIVASSCCVIPLTLGAMGAGAGIFSGLEAIAGWRTPLAIMSGLAIIGGWFAWWRKRSPACPPNPGCATPRRSRATTAMLVIASLVVVLAVGWEYLELPLLKLMRGA